MAALGSAELHQTPGGAASQPPLLLTQHRPSLSATLTRSEKSLQAAGAPCCAAASPLYKELGTAAYFGDNHQTPSKNRIRGTFLQPDAAKARPSLAAPERTDPPPHPLGQIPGGTASPHRPQLQGKERCRRTATRSDSKPGALRSHTDTPKTNREHPAAQQPPPALPPAPLPLPPPACDPRCTPPGPRGAAPASPLPPARRSLCE